MGGRREADKRGRATHQKSASSVGRATKTEEGVVQEGTGERLRTEQKTEVKESASMSLSHASSGRSGEEGDVEGGRGGFQKCLSIVHAQSTHTGEGQARRL